MEKHSHVLMVEVSNFDYIFIAGKTIDDTNFKLISQEVISIEYDNENTLRNFELDYNIIKNIYSIEQRLNCIFKEVILIVDTFDCKIINFSGFKKLNGSQLVKENITYILNLLKSKVNELETKRKILHIFNSNYILDKKSTKNLPIGLFGNFYSHELSFFLIDNNDYNNLQNIFNKCNLRIKKFISKSYIEGTLLINKFQLDTFFKIKIEKKNSQIIYFENSALKFRQNFNFGSDMIIKDISKITGLNYETIINLFKSSKFTNKKENQELIEKDFFTGQNYRKIKKQLIIDIAEARIKELAEIIIDKNINTKSFRNKNAQIFLMIKDQIVSEKLKNSLKFFFIDENIQIKNIIKNYVSQELYDNAFNLVQFGWKKEVVPVIQEKKSIISRSLAIFSNNICYFQKHLLF